MIDKPKEHLELNEEDGTLAIQYLQLVAGIKETPENARKAWLKLKPWQKAKTIEFYNTLSAEEIAAKHAQSRRN